MADIMLSIQNLTKQFGTVTAVDNLSINIDKGEFLTLLGPSGCGKTTLLRCIAGLEDLDGGKILLNGLDVTTAEPNHRNLNTVFQSYALFPHMNVYQNIAYGLKVKHTAKAEIRRRVTDMLEMVSLSGYEKRMPDQLSGGQRQRVALARALVNNPDVLLLDEPLGALDLQLRRQIQSELKRIQRQSGITFIYVTHDQEEALNLSDRIAVMHGGHIEQLDNPDEIFEHPATRFVAQFIGDTNLMDVTVTAKEGSVLTVQYADMLAKCTGFEPEVGDRICLSIRPSRIHVAAEPHPDFTLSGTVLEHTYMGMAINSSVQLEDGSLCKVTSYQEKASLPPVGSHVFLSWELDKAVIIPSAS